jgi:hypothetical protein
MTTTCPDCRYWALQQCCHALAKRGDGHRPSCLFFVDEAEFAAMADRREHPQPTCRRNGPEGVTS